MHIPYFHIDTFTGTRFRGNPAGVCLLDEWLPDDVLRQIAAENRHSETAFILVTATPLGLRWFTPVREVSLCGHATLAAAFVMYAFREYAGLEIRFRSQSGLLTVERRDDLLVLDFPARRTEPCAAPDALLTGLGKPPVEVRRARSYVAIYAAAEDVANLRPDIVRLGEVESSGIIVTAPGDGVDFVSRFFAPRLGIPEDPVTGSAHCTLIPYWAARLGKTRLTARQLSARGGELYCEHLGERVKIGGRAVAYLWGTIEL
jgi:PhzF family phenazine biosynthesis protein